MVGSLPHKNYLVKKKMKKYNRSSGFSDTMACHRMFNAVNQFILSIVASDKIVVHAAVGDVISMLFSVSLVCD
ncbi:MAG: hypothetical protein C4582_01195 [Desulfobacteraceae bacterium]|nr:MAG: hypothetical protein C4582_01195 [Desulfobacteraceae bacterium]